MFLSVIVPAYNVEKYIEKCIQSIAKQDISDYEIVVINDCSSDNTLNVIERLNIQNMVIINKDKNGGLSETRNVGLEVARGDYVMFVDADDYLADNVLGKIEKFAKYNQPDLIYLKYIMVKNGKEINCENFISPCDSVFEGREFLIRELKNRVLPIPACFSIYKKAFLIENELRFKVGILHEDELWTPLCLMSANKIGTLDLYFYYYQIRNDSITQKKDKTKNGIDMAETAKTLDAIVNQMDDDELKTLMNNHIAMIYMKAISRGKLYKSEYKSNIARTFPLKRAYYLKERVKALLFAFSPHLYCCVDQRFGNNI